MLRTFCLKHLTRHIRIYALICCRLCGQTKSVSMLHPLNVMLQHPLPPIYLWTSVLHPQPFSLKPFRQRLLEQRESRSSRLLMLEALLQKQKGVEFISRSSSFSVFHTCYNKHPLKQELESMALANTSVPQLWGRNKHTLQYLFSLAIDELFEAVPQN